MAWKTPRKIFHGVENGRLCPEIGRRRIQGNPAGPSAFHVEQERGGRTTAGPCAGAGIENAGSADLFVHGLVRVARENVVATSRGNDLRERSALVPMQGGATLAGQVEFGLHGDFKAGRGGTKTGFEPVHEVAVAQGNVGANSVREAFCRKQVEDVYAGVAAVD